MKVEAPTKEAKIFIVEDEFIVNENIKLDVQSFGYNVVGSATKGVDAIEQIFATRPDLILMDINLNGSITGLDVARRIKDLNIPVVFLTAYADENTLKEASELGAYGFLTKPFQTLDLVSSIRMAISKSKSVEAISNEKEDAKEKLVTTERIYKQIIENVKDLIYTTDKEGKIKYINQVVKEFGYDIDDFLGKSLFGFAKKEYQEKIKSILNELSSGYQKNIEIEFPMLSNDNKEVWMGHSLTTITDENGEIIGFQGIARNISERLAFEDELLKAKEKALEATEMKSEFLANMSHEIRTPLNGIVGISKLITDTELNAKQREYMRAIVFSTDQLLGIINNTLDLSKLEAEKMTVNTKVIDTVELVSGIEAIYQQRSLEKGINFSFFHDDLIPDYLVGDAVKIKQILHNLVGNALKFTEQGSVKISTYLRSEEKEKNWIEFRVSDTGIGIENDKLEAIFKAFEQSNNSADRDFGGTGLGLAIVQRLVDLLGGEIKVKSTINKGSVFTVVLPLKTASQEEIDSILKLTEEENYILDGTKVLIVEDNKVNQLVTSDLLVSKGCETTICENGQEAIEKLESNAFDIVLMDMQMPVMDGYTAMRIIRSNTESNYSKIPIIALTAHVFSGELEKCIQAGATDYLSKPFEPKELFGMIWKLAKDSKTNDSNESGNTIPQNNSTNNQQGNSTSNTSISNDGNIHFTGIKSIEHPDLNESKKDDFNNHTLVDFKRLKEFLNGNDTILTSTLKAIKETFQECLSDLHKIAKEEDNDNLKRVIHKLKPNLEMIGSIYLHETSLRLEKSSLNGEQGREDLDTVIRGMKRILVIIDDYLLDQLHVY